LLGKGSPKWVSPASPLETEKVVSDCEAWQSFWGGKSQGMLNTRECHCLSTSIPEGGGGQLLAVSALIVEREGTGLGRGMSTDIRCVSEVVRGGGVWGGGFSRAKNLVVVCPRDPDREICGLMKY